jgi:hypothetical protein
MSSFQPCTTVIGQAAQAGVGGNPDKSKAGAIKNKPRAAHGIEPATAKNPPRLEPTCTAGGSSRATINNFSRRPWTVSIPR